MSTVSETSGSNRPTEDNVFVNTEHLPDMILRGSEASLEGLRSTSESTRNSFLQARGGSLLTNQSTRGVACRACGLTTENHADADTENTAGVAGEVFLSESQVLFVTSSECRHDFAIGARCIHLHAMMEEPEVAIYLQLSEEGREDESLDVTLTPLNPEESQPLFDALCKLVSLHPIEDGDEEGNGSGGLFGGGDDFMSRDDLIWAPSAGFGTVAGQAEEEEEDTGATEAERAAMLERLDHLLVVRPEFEIQEGQFDDAEDEE